MSPSEFTIPIHDLDAAGKEFRFAVRAAWIRGALEGEEAKSTDRDGSLEVRVSKSGTDVVVHGRLKAELELPCARCLEPAKVAIDQRLSVLMVPAAGAKARGGDDGEDEYEFSAEEADVIPYEGDTIALDDLVRDELLLELPMIPLCSPDCAGISPPAPTGTLAEEPAERPVDPRLAPLLKLSVAARAANTGSPTSTTSTARPSDARDRAKHSNDTNDTNKTMRAKKE